MTLRKVPELSLLSYVNGSEDQRGKFSQDFYNGLREYGFIILTDHTVDQKLVDRAYDLAKKFFSLSTEVKNTYTDGTGTGQRGYTAYGREHAKGNNNPDMKEFWHVGREIPSTHPFKKYYPDNVWPLKEIPEFKEVFLRLYESMDATATYMLEALTGPLELDKDYFRRMTTDGNSIVRTIHYPPVDPSLAKAGSVRAAAHGDINLITMLVGATASGLQLLDRDGNWLDVETKPGQLVVDSGDMMSRLTNDVIPSTIHRVINPPNDDYSSSRFSMPYFVHPHPDAMITCLPSCVGSGAKYPPISSHEFLMERLRDIGLYK